MDVSILAETYRKALFEDVLPFWLKHGLDTTHGGCFSSLDRDGSLLDTDKSVWVQGRFSWLLSTLNLYEGLNDDWVAAAESGLDFIDGHCVDSADGLMWFQVTQDGLPIRKRRYRFSEAFACLANAASHGVSTDLDRAVKAVGFFETFEAHRKIPGLSPFPEKFTGTRPSKGLSGPMIAINLAQTCRLNRLVGVDWDGVIDECIAEIESDFVRPEIECVMETVASDGSLIDQHFDGRTLNPGHAIEAAWFILEEAKVRGDNAHLIALGTKMLDWMWERGWDKPYGGLLYFTGVDERPIQEYWHDMKFWWPHNEAEIATLLAYQLTGDERYAAMHGKVHEWAWSNFPDPEHGEWFGYLHRDGSVSSPVKGNLWKGPFHIPRMMWKCAEICEEIDSVG